MHEGQAGFRNCMDNVYTLNEIVQGRFREDKETYAFFLDVQKVYDTVWRNGLWLKLWDMGVNSLNSRPSPSPRAISVLRPLTLGTERREKAWTISSRDACRG